MRALVTGASGFVGTYLVRLLRQQGWTVTGLDLRPSPEVHRNIIGNIATLPASKLGQNRYNAVFHLAAISHIPTANENPATAFDANVRGTFRLLRMLRPGPRIICASSGDIYGKGHSGPIPETAPLRPTNAYSASKACADMALSSGIHGHDLVLLRPFNHTGPGQKDIFVAPAFARQIARIEANLQPPVMKVGNLSPARDFLDVRDVVRAYLMAFEKAGSGPYNIGSGKGTVIRDMLRMLLGLSRLKIAVESNSPELHRRESEERVALVSRFRRDTGWQPSIPLRKTLSDILEFEREQCSRKN